MRVLDIYDKKDFYLITYNGKNVFSIMDDFFSNFPLSYRENYDRNLATLEIHRVDNMVDSLDNASYYPSSNILLFKDFCAVPHELVHMASADRDKKLFGICRDGEYSLYEQGLLEGMTEYLASKAIGEEPSSYFLECFTAEMLSSIDGIFEPYFIPNYSKFISLFPNKKNICSLMYGLDFYHDRIKCIDDDSDDIELDRIANSVKDVIDSLIDIELSFDKDIKERKLYADKFMDLITNEDIDSVVGDVYSEYKDYAHHEIKKRLLRRR